MVAGSSAFFDGPPKRFCMGAAAGGSVVDSDFATAGAPKLMAPGLGVADWKREAPPEENLMGVFAFQVLFAGAEAGRSLAGLIDLSLSGEMANGDLPSCEGNCLTGCPSESLVILSKRLRP